MLSRNGEDVLDGVRNCLYQARVLGDDACPAQPFDELVRMPFVGTLGVNEYPVVGGRSAKEEAPPYLGGRLSMTVDDEGIAVVLLSEFYRQARRDGSMQPLDQTGMVGITSPVEGRPTRTKGLHERPDVSAR